MTQEFNETELLLDEELQQNVVSSNLPAIKQYSKHDIIETYDPRFYNIVQLRSPYQSFYDTLKNPFEVEEILREREEVIARHNQLILQQHSKIAKLPSFYYSERNIYGLKTLGWFLVFLISIACVIGFVLCHLSQQNVISLIDITKITWFNPAYLAIPAITGTYSLLSFIFQAIYFFNLKKYINKQNGFFDPSQVSGITQNLYKRLLISFININWGCLIFYFIAGFYILTMFIASYFVTMSYDGIHKGLYFGQLTMGPSDDLTYPLRDFPKLSCIIVGGLVGIVILFQVISQIVNWARINKMEIEFNVPILNIEEKVAIKKATHKRNFICFLVIFLILGLIALSIYFVMRGRKR